MLPLFERRDSPWKFSWVNPYFGDIELQSSMRNASLTYNECFICFSF